MPRTITTLLIANRGEIARRIIRTAHRLGIRTVAVYTSADRSLPFVAEASAAIHIGDPLAYLSMDSILEAAKVSDADAIHPGYGFLSENPHFVERVTAMGLTFVGPAAEAMRALGNKTNAKAIAAKAAVPMAPTLVLDGISREAEVAAVATFGKNVGFPVLIKAAQGGGGRGMRALTADSDIGTELDSARRESLRAFGSDAIFVEKLIAPARHVEVQMVGDSSGAIVALGTRDCTLQRSHQKIIEEAPAPNLSAETISSVYAAVERLGHEARYSNLGTVEFLVAPDGTFSFLEVNSRLQVEHPVTEMTTGLDLVEVQLRIAEGRSLSELGIGRTPQPRGHAIEARLCAETLVDGHPVVSTGRISDLSVPAASADTLRLDVGISVGSEVTHYYDSMIGKVIAQGETRADAVRALVRALEEISVSGVHTNRFVLTSLLRSSEFLNVAHSIQGTKDLLPTQSTRNSAVEEAATVYAAIQCSIGSKAGVSSLGRPGALLHYPPTLTSAWQDHPCWGLSSLSSPSVVEGEINNTPMIARVERGSESNLRIETQLPWGWSTCVVHVAPPGADGYMVTISGKLPIAVRRVVSGSDTWLHLPRGSFRVAAIASTLRHQTGHTESTGATAVVSPLPGKIASLASSTGSRVEAGAILLTLDSMKMEHPIRAPVAGVVSLTVSPGAIVQAGEVVARVAAE